MRKRVDKKIEKRYIIVILLLFLFIILGLLFYFVQRDRNLSLTEKGLHDAFVTVQKVVVTPFQFIGKKIHEITQSQKIYKEYNRLKRREEEMDILETKNTNLEQELSQLNDLLDLNVALSNTHYINATVVNRNLDDWNDTITIDRGEKHGISTGMAVITSKGLVGTISQTSFYYSTVTLLTHPGEKLSVKIAIENDFVYGLLIGYDSTTGLFKMEGISENKSIPEGSKVMTTGFGSKYPSGLLIGTVTGSTKDHFDLAQTISIKPSSSFNHIAYVTVVERTEE